MNMNNNNILSLLLLLLSPLLIQSAFVQQNHHPGAKFGIATTATLKKENADRYKNVPNCHLCEIRGAMHTNNNRLKILSLNMANVKITNPSSESAAELGMTEWPQQTKSKSWEETSAFGETMVRYMLDGRGSLEIRERATNEAATSIKKSKVTLEPGTLVEVSGEVSLYWNVEEEMTILTPGSKDGGILIPVVATLIILLGILITR
eukprot:CAMPEP_0198265586 /NCGR_PEP_ID=MMETSP1447-20131203/23413_1 /TAXON_ID=420782 /ORGANISM="Chaetoceros dichaeta, Strain CCMP1751" /LENGTH=205 /DNA_ID=CAMNT_0043955155 /DNA_START=50 /DNA_END=667 /DNA_ORIENTATION=-